MLGEMLALGSAVGWALSIVLFKRSAHLSAEGLNLFKNTLASTLLILTMLLWGISVDWDRSSEDWWRLGISGFLGITVADTLFFLALRNLGAGMLAILDCVYAPLVVFFSVLMLNESLTLTFAAGAILVIFGLLLATSRGATPPTGLDRPTLYKGAIFAMTSVGLMAFGGVLAKPAIERSDLIEVTTVRLLFGTLPLGLWVVMQGKTKEAFALFRPQREWRNVIPASILGAYLTMIFWMGGMKYTAASIAGVLNQLATAFTLFFGWLILKERLTLRQIGGGAIAMAGAIVILVWGSVTSG